MNLFYPERLLTVADLDVMPHSLPSGDVKYELVRGRLILMSPADDRHGRSRRHWPNSLLANDPV